MAIFIWSFILSSVEKPNVLSDISVIESCGESKVNGIFNKAE